MRAVPSRDRATRRRRFGLARRLSVSCRLAHVNSTDRGRRVRHCRARASVGAHNDRRLATTRPSGLGPPAVAPAPGRRRHVGYDPPTSLGFVPSEVRGRPAACDHPAERSWATGCGARTGPPAEGRKPRAGLAQSDPPVLQLGLQENPTHDPSASAVVCRSRPRRPRPGRRGVSTRRATAAGRKSRRPARHPPDRNGPERRGPRNAAGTAGTSWPTPSPRSNWPSWRRRSGPW